MPDTTEQLKQLVEQAGLVRALNVIAGICYEKSIHLRDVWHDEDATQKWGRCGNAVRKASEKCQMVLR